MNDQPKQDRWAFLKQQAPMIVTVFCFIGFMNTRSATEASLFGMLVAVAIAWQIRRFRSTGKRLGEPIMELGRLYAEPPSRMRPWYGLAVFAFALLGLVTFLGMSDADLASRLGMSVINWAIVGAFIAIVDRRWAKWGAGIMGTGFVLAGALFVWQAVMTLNSGDDNAQLNAVRWSVFGAFLLLVGMSIVVGLLSQRAKTPIYPGGVVGPHGFVPWEGADPLELRQSDGQDFLTVGAYTGWTIWIQVPEDRREAVEQFLSTRLGSQKPDRVARSRDSDSDTVE